MNLPTDKVKTIYFKYLFAAPVCLPLIVRYSRKIAS